MNRRNFAAAGLGTFAVAAAGSRAAAQQSEQRSAAAHHGDGQHDAHMKCAEACGACQRQCDICATHCAGMLWQGNKEHLETLMTCRDCADFCATAAEITARGGPFAALICQGCAEACAACAKACEKFPDDEHMKRCADECKRCEQACRDMLEHAAPRR